MQQKYNTRAMERQQSARQVQRRAVGPCIAPSKLKSPLHNHLHELHKPTAEVRSLADVRRSSARPADATPTVHGVLAGRQEAKDHNLLTAEKPRFCKAPFRRQRARCMQRRSAPDTFITSGTCAVSTTTLVRGSDHLTPGVHLAHAMPGLRRSAGKRTAMIPERPPAPRHSRHTLA
jgi:hypothetical protein